MRPYQESIAKRLAYKMKEIKERSSPMSDRDLTRKSVPRGTPLTLSSAVRMTQQLGADKAKERAKALGYTIPDPEEYRMYRE